MVGNTAWSMFKFREELILNFMKQGHQVIILAPEDQGVEYLEKLGCTFIHLPVDRKGTNPIKDFTYTIKLTKLMLDIKPDISLLYTIKPVLYGSLASWLAQVPVRVSIITGLGYTFTINNWLNQIAQFLYKLLLPFSNQVWFLNEDDRQVFTTLHLISSLKTFILPGEGVNTDYYRRSHQNHEKTIFTFIGRLLRDKGVELFYQCAKDIKQIHPEIEFLIVGPVDDGNPEGISQEAIKEWHREGSIKYLGIRHDVKGILETTSCLVLPAFFREGIPRVLLEASAMGIPCITTNVPGCKDIIKDGFNGIIVESKDKEALKEAILKFISQNSSEKKRLGDNGIDFVRNHFSSDIINSIYNQRLSF